MLSSLTAARSEAMKRGRNTLVVPSADCATWGDDWTKGWLVFVDNDASQTISSGDDVLSCEPKVPAAVTAVTGDAPEGFQDPDGKFYLMFNGSGYPRLLSGAFQSSSLDFTNGDSTRRIISNPAGRLRVCKPDGRRLRRRLALTGRRRPRSAGFRQVTQPRASTGQTASTLPRSSPPRTHT